jgi:hypothetical protein
MRAVERAWGNDGAIPLDGNGEEDTAPEPRAEMLARFKRTTREELIAASPDKRDLSTIKPIDFIKGMFDADDIVNIQRTSREHGTLMKVSDLPSDLDEFKFLNPSTFKALTYTDKKTGRTMTRCNANVKERVCELAECDFPSTDPDADANSERFNEMLLTLAKYVPLKAIVDTGGKSGHGWIDASQATPEDIKTLRKLLVMLYADKQMFVKSQIARMPNVSAASKGRGRQTLIYWNPDMGKDDLKWDIAGFEKHIQDAAKLEYFYCSKSKNYYMQTDSGRWSAVNRQSLIAHLARQGYRNTRNENESLSPAENAIAEIELRKSVEAVMTGTSGHHAGYYHDNGITYLVLKSPKIIKPRKGDWSTIRGYLQHGMRADPIQYPLFLGMLSADVKNFRNNGQRRSRQAPYQVPHIVGPGNAGKTVLTRLLPYLFGGRKAKANPLFDPKGSDFNSEMHQAELLFLDDAAVLESGYKYRHTMSETIKEVSVGGGIDYHGKFGDKLAIQPWWRLWRMMNDDPSTLATLPLMDAGVADKWNMFFWGTLEGGSVEMVGNWFEPWFQQMVSEVPAFLHYLLHEHVILPEHRDPTGRYAIRNYKNPTLMEMAQADSSENYLMHRIDTEGSEVIFNDFDSDAPQPWQGTAGDLYDLLSEVGTQSSQRRFTKTCPSPRVLSSQLKILEKSHPHRFQYSGRGDLTPKKIDGNLYWRVSPKKINVSEEDCF